MKTAPLFIVLEGLDGVGKSTVAATLARHLQAELLSTPQAELRPVLEHLRSIGASPLSLTLAYAATVATASGQVAAARADGRCVVMDRYYLSTWVYGRVLREEMFPSVALGQIAELLVPADVTVFLRASTEVRRERILARGHSSQEDPHTCFQDVAGRLEAEYQRCAHTAVAGRWLQVDVSGLTPLAIVARICAELALPTPDQGGDA